MAEITSEAPDSEDKKKKRRAEEPEPFLHCINLESLKKDTGLSIDEIAKIAGIAEARNLSKWTIRTKPNGARPNFNAIVKLLEHGATVETLFGVEYKDLHKVYKIESSIDDVFNSPQFQERMKAAIVDLKERGLIK